MVNERSQIKKATCDSIYMKFQEKAKLLRHKGGQWLSEAWLWRRNCLQKEIKIGGLMEVF